MALLNIFANFFIDSEERYLRMQDSFHSFKEIFAEKWVINVRGKFARDTISFLRDNLGHKLIAHERYSKGGWFYDTRQMLPDIDGKYVFFWLEDHINLAKIDMVENIISEMKEKDLDYMLYTFWQNGRLRERYRGVPFITGCNIDYLEHNVANNSIIQSNVGGSYLISIASICKLSLFKKIVLADDPIPCRWPKETPFDFEKAPNDTHWLPLNIALPRQELFASIDDDHGCKGYCLQARGLYPVREKRKSYAISAKSKYRSLVSDIKFLVNMAINPSQFKHILRWIKSKKKDFLVEAPATWITFDAIDFINKRIGRGAHMFEYGSGGSTLFWLHHGVQVVSVEHDVAWYTALREKIGANSSLEYLLVEPVHMQDLKDRDPSNPDDYASADEIFYEYSFCDYASQIDRFPDNSFDMIVIDGRARPSCIKHSFKKVKIGGFLVLDDSDRKYYLEKATVFLSNYDHSVFRGAKPCLPWFAETSVFTRRA